MTESTIKPAHTIRYGSVQVAIWKNLNTKGVNYSISMERRYFANGKWSSTPGFFREDLLALAKALNDAHSWIYARTKEPTAEEAAA